MRRPLTVSPDEADWVFDQARGVFTPGNDTGLADPAPHQEIFSSPNSSAKELVPARNVTEYEVNGASLAFRELQSSVLPPSEIENQLDNPAVGPLPARYERYSPECVPDEMFTGSMIGHTTTEVEELIKLVDQILEPNITSSPAQAQPSVGSMKHQTRMGVPEMLSRFLKVDMLNDSLRYEASIATSEGRVQQGEDMVRRRVLGGWEWNTGPLSTAIALNTPWEWSNGVVNDCMEDHCMEDGCMEGEDSWIEAGYGGSMEDYEYRTVS